MEKGFNGADDVSSREDAILSIKKRLLELSKQPCTYKRLIEKMEEHDFYIVSEYADDLKRIIHIEQKQKEDSMVRDSRLLSYMDTVKRGLFSVVNICPKDDTAHPAPVP